MILPFFLKNAWLAGFTVDPPFWGSNEWLVTTDAVQGVFFVQRPVLTVSGTPGSLALPGLQ
jgi:hypothetical protein